MARINIEPKLFLDTRFQALSRMTGSHHTALGMVADAFVIAQKYWVEDFALIPENIWMLSGLEILIEVHLAQRRDGGIYVCGSEEQFDWLIKKRTACKAAGVKSAASRLAKFGTSQPAQNIGICERPFDNPRTTPNKNVLTSEHDANALTLTPTLNSEIHTSVSTDHPPAADKPKKKAKPESVLLGLWNTHCGTLPKARGMSAKRHSSEAARLKENASLEYWTEVISRIAASGFCRGEAGGSWRADFEWFLKPDTHLKVMEGKYDDKISSKAAVSSIYEDMSDPEVRRNGW